MPDTTTAPADTAEQAMPGDEATSTEIIQRTATSPHVLDRAPLMTDDEIRRSWRIAASLAKSQMFKDARQAEQAFAKILIGRDLGLTPTQSMTGIHIVEGKPEIAAVMMATFVRSRDGYDFRQAWIKETPPARQGERAVREAVYVDEDTAADLREVVGCAIEFTVDGKMRGVSTFTIEDAARAGLDQPRGNAKSNYIKYPRNMLFARAMSNGCKWLIPEVLAGLPIYVEGEIEAQKSIGEGDGDGSAQGLDLGPGVDAVIARAIELGHAALSDRASIEVLLGHRPPGDVAEWVRVANKELDEVPQDADVVTADLRHSVAQTPDPSHEATDGPQAPPEAAETVDSPGVQRDPDAVAQMRAQANAWLDFADSLDAQGKTEEANRARDDAATLMVEVEAASDENQIGLEF